MQHLIFPYSYFSYIYIEKIKLIKLSNIIIESKEEILSSKDKRMLSIIHDKVWKNHANDDTVKYDVVEELRNLDENFLIILYEFLNDTMGFENKEQIDYYIRLFINNFQEDGDYDKLTQSGENIIPDSNINHMVLSNHLDQSPLLVVDKEENYDGMSIFYDMVGESHYMVGDESTTLNAIRLMIDDRYYSFYDAHAYNGGLDGITQFFFITDTDKRIIAGEYAEHGESDMRDEDVLHMAKHESGSEKIKDLVDRYESLEDGTDDPMLNTGIPPKVEMDDIMDTLREEVREIIYDAEYEQMDTYLDDWLIEHGYLTEDKWGSPVFTKQYLNKWDEPNLSKLPNWLNFDLEGLVNHHTTIDRAGELSNIDNYYDIERIDGDTYYIIETDY